MTEKKLEKGMLIEKQVDTDISMAADRFHRKSPRVLSTASLIGIMQASCAEVIAPFLSEDEMVVSTKIEMSHFGAVPVGTPVRLKTEITEVQGRRIIFKIQARDSAQTVASGKNDMFIIDRKRFEKGIARHKAETEKLK